MLTGIFKIIQLLMFNTIWQRDNRSVRPRFLLLKTLNMQGMLNGLLFNVSTEGKTKLHHSFQ